MSPAELPEPGLADVTAGHPGEHQPPPASGSTSPNQEVEIDRLQLRLNELRTRIHSALPEGYDLNELVAAKGDRHESEEVFEITGELNALQHLAGPLMVPGKTPQPAFDELPPVEPIPGSVVALPSAVHAARLKWLAIILVLVVAIIGGVALLLPYL